MRVLRQSKKHSHYEVLANQAFGLLVGFLLLRFVIMPIAASGKIDFNTVSVLSSFLLFIVSYCRTYLIRRFFIWRGIG